MSNLWQRPQGMRPDSNYLLRVFLMTPLRSVLEFISKWIERQFRSLSLMSAVCIYFLIIGPLVCLTITSSDVIFMEGIIVDGARYMELADQYAVPHLYGEIYSYKPPLANWLTLASFRLFDQETAFSLRFPFVFSALSMGFFVLLLIGRASDFRSGLFSAMASVSGGLLVQKIQLAEWDTLLAAYVGIAVTVACVNLSAKKSSVWLWLLGYIALGMAFLVKGIPAFMFYGPGLILAAVLTRNFRELFRPGHLLASVICLIIIGAWVWSAYLAEGMDAFEQPLAEAREKGFTWSAETIFNSLFKPYLLLAVFLPWTLMLPFSLSANKDITTTDRIANAAAGFFLMGLFMFILVPATESRYLLPLAVPIGILCGLSINRVFPAGKVVRRRIIEFITGAFCIAVIVYPFFEDGIGPWRQAVLGISGCLGLLIVWIARNQKTTHVVPVLLMYAAGMHWLVYSQVVLPYRASTPSLLGVANQFENHLSTSSEVWTAPVSKHFRHSSLFFYLRRPVKTFRAGEQLPEAGEYIILFGDEHHAIMDGVPFKYEIVEHLENRGCDFYLARVL